MLRKTGGATFNIAKELNLNFGRLNNMLDVFIDSVNKSCSRILSVDDSNQNGWPMFSTFHDELTSLSKRQMIISTIFRKLSTSSSKTANRTSTSASMAPSSDPIAEKKLSYSYHFCVPSIFN